MTFRSSADESASVVLCISQSLWPWNPTPVPHLYPAMPCARAPSQGVCLPHTWPYPICQPTSNMLYRLATLYIFGLVYVSWRTVVKILDLCISDPSAHRVIHFFAMRFCVFSSLGVPADQTILASMQYGSSLCHIDFRMALILASTPVRVTLLRRCCCAADVTVTSLLLCC